MARFRKQTRFKVWYVDHDGQIRMEKLYQPPLLQKLHYICRKDDVYVVRRSSGQWEVLDLTTTGTPAIFAVKERQTATAWAAMRAALIGRKDT